MTEVFILPDTHLKGGRLVFQPPWCLYLPSAQKESHQPVRTHSSVLVSSYQGAPLGELCLYCSKEVWNEREPRWEEEKTRNEQLVLVSWLRSFLFPGGETRGLEFLWISYVLPGRSTERGAEWAASVRLSLYRSLGLGAQLGDLEHTLTFLRASVSSLWSEEHAHG